jgi:hypothetical protein
MSGTNVTDPKGGTSSLEAPTFGPGMLLHHEDLEGLRSYTRDLSRLMFRSLFGCGVICGLVVDTDPKCRKTVIRVTAGVALACSGDPIELPRAQSIPLADDCDAVIEGPLWVILCATTKRCAPRVATCSSDDDEAPPVHTRERAGFEVRVVNQRPDCACSCLEPEGLTENEEFKCYAAHEEGECGCRCAEGSACSCDCVLLAELEKDEDNGTWTVHHEVRRFIRPMLMVDPLLTQQMAAKKAASDKAANEAAQKAKRVADDKASKERADKMQRDLDERTRELADERAKREAAEKARDEAEKALLEQSGTRAPKTAKPGRT